MAKTPHRGLRPAQGLYIVFNRSVAEEATRRFPARVRCATAHSLVFRAVAGPYWHLLSGARIPSPRVEAALGITLPLTLGGKVIEPWTLAYIAQHTVRTFCCSAARMSFSRAWTFSWDLSAGHAGRRLIGPGSQIRSPTYTVTGWPATISSLRGLKPSRSAPRTDAVLPCRIIAVILGKPNISKPQSTHALAASVA